MPLEMPLEMLLEMPLEMIVVLLLAVRRVVREQLAKLDKMVLDQVRGDKLCRRLMRVPGVGEAAT